MKAKNFVRISLGLMAMGLSISACHRETKAERYMREARELTAQCPMTLDLCTQMDSMTYSLDAHSFTYYYTVSNISEEVLLAQREELYGQLRQRLLNAPEMQAYINDGMSFRYVYRSDGKVLMQFLFESAEINH